MVQNFTARSVARLKPAARAYYVFDAGVQGLHLRVAPNGTKSWSVRYRLHGRHWRYGLGDAAAVSLTSARKAAKAALTLVRSVPPVNPAEQKQQQRDADTMGTLAARYMTEAQKTKRSWKSDRRILDTIVLPKWRHRPVTAITRRDVRELVESVNGTVYPNRVRALLVTLFNFGLEKEITETNPAVSTKRPLKKEPSRDRVMTDAELRTFWAATAKLELAMGAYWRVRLLTVQRGGEVAGMRWADVDLRQALWLIPATHTKNKKEHLVPLSDSVIAMLTALRTQADRILTARRQRKDARPHPITHVFDGARGNRQRSEAAATFGIADFRGHDLRRTAATNMRKAGIPRADVSAVLNHKISGPEATEVYDRYDAMAEKKIALDTWARRLQQILDEQDGARILPITKARR